MTSRAGAESRYNILDRDPRKWGKSTRKHREYVPPMFPQSTTEEHFYISLFVGLVSCFPHKACNASKEGFLDINLFP